MQQLMGLNAEFGIRVNPWLVRSVLTAIKRQTVHFPVGVGDLIRPVTSFLTALSMFGFCRVVIIIPPHFRWKAGLRVVVQFQLRSLLLKLTASVLSQASQSVLDEVVVAPSVEVEGSSCLLLASSEMFERGNCVDSFYLRGNDQPANVFF